VSEREAKILGIDPGIGCTGYGLIAQNGDRARYMTSGEIRSHPSDPFPHRLRVIFEGLVAVIALHAPSVVAVEETFLARNFQSALKLGQARGAALLAVALRDIPIFEYSPTAVKIGIVGYGRATKTQIKKMVQQILTLPSPPTSEHEADALAIALCHAHTLRYRERVVGAKNVEGVSR